MARRLKSTAITVRVPQTREEAAQFIAEIGSHQRDRQMIQAQMNEGLAAVKAAAEELARPHAEAIAALMKGLEIWAAANRDELTKGGKVKTAALSSGELRWRTTPPAVRIRDLAEAIGALMSVKLDRFLRRKVEIDKEAILREPETVQGITAITISQREELVIVPFETDLEEVA